MDLETIQKPKKKKEKKITGIRISEEDLKFVRTNNISLGKLAHEVIEELRLKQGISS